ncbi:MAG: hypothetical protein ACLFVU_03730 [Phycisphaerae bacterium]
MSLYLLRQAIGSLESELGHEMAVPFKMLILFAGIGGVLAGLVESVKLCEATGPIGQHLMDPVIGMHLLGMLLIHNLSAALAPVYPPEAHTKARKSLSGLLYSTGRRGGPETHHATGRNDSNAYRSSGLT